MSANAVIFSERLQPFTPTLSGSVRDPDLGSGAIIASRWGRVVDSVSYFGQVRLGSDPDPGEGAWQLSLPVRAVGGDAGWGALLGKGYCVSAGTGRTCHLIARLEPPSTGFAVFEVFPGPGAPAGNVMTDGLPWVWSADDRFHWRMDFEAAAW